jgi:hypothetical protein
MYNPCFQRPKTTRRDVLALVPCCCAETVQISRCTHAAQIEYASFVPNYPGATYIRRHPNRNVVSVAPLPVIRDARNAPILATDAAVR